MKNFPGGMGGSNNMNNLLKKAQQMQKEMMDVQEKLKEVKYELSSGGGAVNIVINGKKEFLEIKIDKDVVDKDDVEMLEDLILTSINAAVNKVEEENNKEMSKLTGGLNIPGF